MQNNNNNNNYYYYYYYYCMYPVASKNLGVVRIPAAFIHFIT
jgi:hypothetical protein